MENLLIVFAKNIELGKVKTRLAKTIGDDNAFEVYKNLVKITEDNTERLENCDIHIYFSDHIIESKWVEKKKFVQHGTDLGERMLHAFEHSFSLGYKRIIGVGTDLPDLNSELMKMGIDALKSNDVVFGPAEDGGYYLVGMNQLHSFIFENKKWSTEGLLESTISEIKAKGYTVSELIELNDIDTIDDLKSSSIANEFSYMLKEIK